MVQTRMHAAAALCAVKDGRLMLQLQPDVVSRLKSALQGLDGSHDQVNVHAVLDEILASRGICLVNNRMRGNSRCDALYLPCSAGCRNSGPARTRIFTELAKLVSVEGAAARHAAAHRRTS